MKSKKITYLYIVKGALKGFRIKARDGLTIGRNSSHVNLKEREVSGRHAMISQDDEGRFFIKDQNTDIGTLKNDFKIHKSILKDGDKIQIGQSIFIVKLATEEPVKTKKPHQRLQTYG